ncbi:trichohyalin [Tribolium castaneum]|uniref:trichohyalin n=1 Tax=Tribolium castaneum TaxID=7070 RepID=UPI0030FE0880
MSKPERLRFTIFDDLVLLREVLHQNPYEKHERWKEIREIVVNVTEKAFTVRAVKDHVEYLLALLAKDDRANLRKSATEEQSDEKEQLLLQIREMSRGFKTKNVPKFKHNEVQQSVLAEVDIKKENESTNSSDGEGTQQNVSTLLEQRRAVKRPCGQPLKNSSLQFLREKQQSERSIRLRELQLEEKKLALEERKIALQEAQMKLEEKKFQMEKNYQEQKLKMEIEERKRGIESQKQNYTLINALLHMVQEKQDLH